MSTLTVNFLYAVVGLFALLAPYLLVAFLASGIWWMWPIGIALFMTILTFLPPPVALFSTGLALVGITLLLLRTLWQRYKRAAHS
ncbi:hypothetical protein [Ferrimonas pelagia]|uniref:DUF4175 domain-containing protein n=1 Tax=Ferrimonas pelagia TaxID=1177826 RepID=A0ABP9ESC7_9GAMM